MLAAEDAFLVLVFVVLSGSFLVGLVGNVLVIALFFRTSKRSSSLVAKISPFFFNLAVVDLVVVLYLPGIYFLPRFISLCNMVEFLDSSTGICSLLSLTMICYGTLSLSTHHDHYIL